MTLGENGIIKMAEKAGKNYVNAAEEEKIKLDGLLNETWGTDIPQTSTLVSQITPDDYGKTINYSANGVNDWKVFYNDGKNVYIIASDYLDMSVTPIDLTTTKMIKGNGKYTVYWDSSIGTNIEVVETLNNTSNWNAFASGKGGESATGGPTYEMLADSWNANPKTNNITLDPTNYKEGLTDSTGLYIPHTSDVDGCVGYWLASSDNIYPNHVFAMVCKSSAVYYNPFTSDMDGIRPVVCLKAGTLGAVEDTVSIIDVVTIPKSNPTLASQITPDDYGKTINYSANGVNDWKVFYNDGTNVYIIASNYLDMSVTPIDLATTKMIKGNGKYTVYWDSSIGTNIEVVETLNNTSNWNAFASGKGGESATGGPTYEMLADSWNANPKTNNITLDPTNYKEGLTDSTGLYIPHTSDVDGCVGYWLASSDNIYPNHVFAMVCKSSAVYYNPFTSDMDGIRPVVCLNKEVTGTVGYTITID